jgi:hypothetical protein
VFGEGEQEAVHSDYDEPMPDSFSNQASITVCQDGIKSIVAAFMRVQHYEVFVDDQKIAELNGYTTRTTCSVSPGSHAIYVRVYARDSVSVTRIYGSSRTLSVDLSPGEHKFFSCGLLPGPLMRTLLLFGSLMITLLFASGLGPLAYIPGRKRSLLVMGMALVTLACCWYGYSSKPGSSIYLREGYGAK